MYFVQVLYMYNHVRKYKLDIECVQCYKRSSHNCAIAINSSCCLVVSYGCYDNACLIFFFLNLFCLCLADGVDYCDTPV